MLISNIKELKDAEAVITLFSFHGLLLSIIMQAGAINLPYTKLDLDQSSPLNHTPFLQDKFDYCHHIKIIHLLLQSSLPLSWFLIPLEYPTRNSPVLHLLSIPFKLRFLLGGETKFNGLAKLHVKLLHIFQYTHIKWKRGRNILNCSSIHQMQFLNFFMNVIFICYWYFQISELFHIF